MTLVDAPCAPVTAAMALVMALALLLSGTALAQTTADAVAAVAIDDSATTSRTWSRPRVSETTDVSGDVTAVTLAFTFDTTSTR